MLVFALLLALALVAAIDVAKLYRTLTVERKIKRAVAHNSEAESELCVLANRVATLEEKRAAAATYLSRFIACRVCGCLYDRASSVVPDLGESGCCSFHRPVGRSVGVN